MFLESEEASNNYSQTVYEWDQINVASTLSINFDRKSEDPKVGLGNFVIWVGEHTH